MRVDEREELPKENEVLYCHASHMEYIVVKAHGERTGRLPLMHHDIVQEAFTVQWEDGNQQDLALMQMYHDEYMPDAYPPGDIRNERRVGFTRPTANLPA